MFKRGYLVLLPFFIWLVIIVNIDFFSTNLNKPYMLLRNSDSMIYTYFEQKIVLQYIQSLFYESIVMYVYLDTVEKSG